MQSPPDDKSAALDAVRNFAHKSILENLSASIHKEFASYFNPVDKQQLLLLGNRKVYSTDKTKIQRFKQNKKKDDAVQKRSEARAALPSTCSISTKDHSTKSCAQLPAKAPKPQESCSKDDNHEKKRRTRKEVNY